MDKRTERIAELHRLASARSSTEEFIDAVQAHLDVGLSIFEVAESTHGTDWRYSITSSGTQIELARISSLRNDYGQALDAMIKGLQFLRTLKHEVACEFNDLLTLQERIGSLILPREFKFQSERLAQALNDHQYYFDGLALTEFDGFEDGFFYGGAFDLTEHGDSGVSRQPFSREARWVKRPWSKDFVFEQDGILDA